MSNGHTIIPIDGSELANESLNYVKDRMLFSLDSLPKGRFPTLHELRQVINESGYDLEETHDWYVTSDNDFTEIWFSDETKRDEDSPTHFWFRRGSIIVLDIMQKLANQCGSFLVVDHSGAVAVLIVPDSVFDVTVQSEKENSFLSVMSRRIPIIVEQLDGTSVENALFLLSQIRQALSSVYEVQRYELFQIAHKGLLEYAKYLKHNDTRLRFLSFDLISILRQGFYTYSESLGEAINNEIDPETKTHMIWAIESLVTPIISASDMNNWVMFLLDTLAHIYDDNDEAPSVRFAAANLLVRANYGYKTTTIRTIFVEALTQPELYETRSSSTDMISKQTLQSIELLLLNHRIEILLTALPQITFAQDAHEVLRTLLDNVFFGNAHDMWRSSLPDTYLAERPDKVGTKFRDNLPDNWLYPSSPIKLSASELLPFQHQILKTVITLNVPWMVHSNLLEKYGLPVTRAELRAMLKN